MYTYDDLRREDFHNSFQELNIDYNFYEISYDDRETERIEIDCIDAFENCYDLFKIFRKFDDVITRFCFKNDKFYIFIK